jgi:type II secretory pathway component GspD/PulD (secretin)
MGKTMSNPIDLIIPMLREMRAENASLHDKTRIEVSGMEKRIAKIENSLTSFRQALTADTLMSKLITGEFEERIELLEAKVRNLETTK